MSAFPASAVILKNLRNYIISHGWFQVEHTNQRVEIFETAPDGSGGYASLAIPSSIEFRDAGSLIEEAVQLVASYEASPLQNIVDHLLRWDRDILRTRLFKIQENDNSLPLGVASNVIAVLKEFVGYAAFAHSEPRPFFDHAGAISGTFTEHCLFGHTFAGSFGLTIECPFKVTPVLPMEGIEQIVPFERQIFERVANGLLTLKESLSEDSIEPLLAGYLTGLNANMCRKLAAIYENADGRRVEYDICWSPQLHTAYEKAWKPLIFDGRAHEIACLAASELEKAETFPDSLVKGRIVNLKSEMPPGLDDQAEFEHIITMHWEREKGQTVKIRVPLSPQQYMQACDAHKDGNAISIRGVPEKSGKFWTLTKAHDFTV